MNRERGGNRGFQNMRMTSEYATRHMLSNAMMKEYPISQSNMNKVSLSDCDDWWQSDSLRRCSAASGWATSRSYSGPSVTGWWCWTWTPRTSTSSPASRAARTVCPRPRPPRLSAASTASRSTPAAPCWPPGPGTATTWPCTGQGQYVANVGKILSIFSEKF